MMKSKRATQLTVYAFKPTTTAFLGSNHTLQKKEGLDTRSHLTFHIPSPTFSLPFYFSLSQSCFFPSKICQEFTMGHCVRAWASAKKQIPYKRRF